MMISGGVARRFRADFWRILSGTPHAIRMYGAGLRDLDGLAIDAVALDGGAGCVAPRPAPGRAGRYPLAEPLYPHGASCRAGWLPGRRASTPRGRCRRVTAPIIAGLLLVTLAGCSSDDEHDSQIVATVRTIVPAEQAAVERSARDLPPAPIPSG